MKKIEALINPSRLETVKSGLSKIGVNRMTILEAKNWDGHTTSIRVFRGCEFSLDFLPKVKLEVIVDDEQTDAVIEVMEKRGETAKGEESNVYVSTVERGNLALV